MHDQMHKWMCKWDEGRNSLNIWQHAHDAQLCHLHHHIQYGQQGSDHLLCGDHKVLCNKVKGNKLQVVRKQKVKHGGQQRQKGQWREKGKYDHREAENVTEAERGNYQKKRRKNLPANDHGGAFVRQTVHQQRMDVVPTDNKQQSFNKKDLNNCLKHKHLHHKSG